MSPSSDWRAVATSNAKTAFMRSMKCNAALFIIFSRKKQTDIKTQKAVAQRSQIGNMKAQKNRSHDRCRIATARLEIPYILKTAFLYTGLEIRVVLWPQSTKSSVGPPDSAMWWSGGLLENSPVF